MKAIEEEVPIKVTLISGEYPPMRGGVGDYTALLADSLRRCGVEVTVLTSRRAERANIPGDPAVAPVVTDWGIGLGQVVANHLRRASPDLVHIQYQTGAYDMQLGINLLPWRLRLVRHRARIVVTFHDLKEPYLLPKIGPARHLATHLIGAGADAVIVTNPEDFVRLSDPANPSRTRLAFGRRPLRAIPIGSNIPAEPPHGYDRAEWRNRLGARDGDLVVGFFGFLTPSKGIDSLVDAFIELARRGAPVRLLMIGAMAGDGYNVDRQYEHQVRQRLDSPEARGRVGWTGFVQAADVAAHLRACDVCVLPFRDGASLRHGTLMAALGQNLPIITTYPRSARAIDGVPSLVNEENVLLVPADDPTSLARAIERLSGDCALREKLGAGAARLAAAFDWNHIARQTIDLYQMLLGTP